MAISTKTTKRHLSTNQSTVFPPRYSFDINSNVSFSSKVQSILHEMNLLNINDISVQFNTAEVNDLLWEVKSYVSIMPLRMPDGLPETEIDLENFRLLSTGELVNSALRLPKERILSKNISSGDMFSRYPILKAREAIFNPTCKGNKAKGRYKRLGITQNWNR